MNILSHEAVKNLSALYSQEDVDDPIVSCRFYHLFSDWFWYPVEFRQEEGLFFGFVRGFERELGYFSVAEFQETEERTGVSFIVDPAFTPMKFSEVKLLPNRQMPDEGVVVISIM